MDELRIPRRTLSPNISTDTVTDLPRALPKALVFLLGRNDTEVGLLVMISI
jgi:hypothetical protein